MDIFLVRHGEASAAWGQASDPGLSDLGWQQAESSAKELLAQVAGDVQLISSPLLRAQETSSPLAKLLSAEVSIDKAFSEIPSPVPFDERQAWLQAFFKQRWNEQPESLLAWRKRALDSLKALERPTVIFSHFLILNAVVGQLTDREETVFFAPDNASITKLKLEGGHLELVELGRELKTHVN